MASERPQDDDGTVVEVVAWDDDGHDPGPGPARRPPARRRWRPLAVVVVLGLLAGAAQLYERRQETARAAAAAAMPGTVPPVDGELVAEWQQDPWFSAYQAVGDVVVLFRSGGAVRGVDPGTGQERWTLGEPVLGCWPSGESPGEEPPVAVLCRGRSSGTGSPDVLARLLLVAGATGEVLGEQLVSTPSYAPTAVGEDVVLVHAEPDRLTVVRRGMADGADRWRAEIPGDARARGGRVSTRHGLVVLQGPVTAVLDADDGAVLGTWSAATVGGTPVTEPATVRVLRHGFAVRGPGSEARTRGYDRAGDRLALLPGLPVEPLVTDGSDADLVLSVTPDLSTLVAVHPESREERWRLPFRAGTALVARDGALVLARDGEVVAVDLRTGRDRWRTPVPEISPRSGGVTDGHVLVVAADLGRSSQLVALDLDDGTVRWAVPAPTVPSRAAGTVTHDFPWVWLGGLGGHAVVLSDAGMTGLR